MLKILWKKGEIALEERFLLLSTIFCYLILDFYVKTRIRFSLRDKRLFEINEVEITRVDCNLLPGDHFAKYHVREIESQAQSTDDIITFNRLINC